MEKRRIITRGRERGVGKTPVHIGEENKLNGQKPGAGGNRAGPLDMYAIPQTTCFLVAYIHAPERTRNESGTHRHNYSYPPPRPPQPVTASSSAGRVGGCMCFIVVG